MKHLFCWQASLSCMASLALSSPLPALVGMGESDAGLLDVTSPTSGNLTAPPSADSAPFSITFAGAGDSGSLEFVELWFRKEGENWDWSGEVVMAASGSFDFTPSGVVPASHGIYYFDLVAQDSVGNRSAVPSGSSGAGQGSTEFSTDTLINDWWVLE